VANFFPPLRDRLLRQFGISESLSFKAMMMVHIASVNLYGAFRFHRKSLSYILHRVGDVIQAGAVVSDQNDFFTSYSI